MTQSMPGFPGITHVAVTVSDLARSTAWYADLFGTSPVLDEDVEAGAFHHTVFALGGGNLFGLHTHVESGRRRSTSAAQDSTTSRSAAATGASSRCGAAGWTSSASPTARSSTRHYGSGLSFRDPDGIALEFFAPPAA